MPVQQMINSLVPVLSGIWQDLRCCIVDLALLPIKDFLLLFLHALYFWDTSSYHDSVYGKPTKVGGFFSQTTAQSCWRETVCNGPSQPLFPGTWDKYNYSPDTRTVSPKQILDRNNTYISKFPGQAKLQGNGSLLVFDFQQEVGGHVTLTYSAKGIGKIGLAFSESSNWTGEDSDGSNGSFGPDGALYANVTTTSEASYTMPDEKLRGGFRYLSLFVVADNDIEVDLLDIKLEISFQPTWSNLRAYAGYFNSNDELLNRIWYAGAYTLQTNAISPTTGRVYPLLPEGWLNDAYIGSDGGSVYVDGAKRDRTIWTGDLCVAIPSILVSLGDPVGVRDTLQVQIDYQQSSGEIPMAGPPLNFYGSDPYHLSTMIAYYEYVLYSNDIEFLTKTWENYKKAMTFVVQKIDDTGLFYCTGVNDWGRYAQGGHNTEANMLMYYSLTTGTTLATWANEPDLATKWADIAEVLKYAMNNSTNNWDPSVGAFKDSDTDASVHPQDGNSFALMYNATYPERTDTISLELTNNWTPIGSISPELPGTITGCTSSLEVNAHLAAYQSTRALDLIRLSWGWYLNNPKGTNSTFIEGYLADGTFGYRATSGYEGDYSYTSHAHGWSTGPTYALSTYVVGIKLVAPGGKIWSLEPQFGDLKFAEGGFGTPLGKFWAGWKLVGGGYTYSFGTPDTTAGKLVLPAEDPSARLVLDGVEVVGAYDAGRKVIVVDCDGGDHEVSLTY